MSFVRGRSVKLSLGRTSAGQSKLVPHKRTYVRGVRAILLYGLGLCIASLGLTTLVACGRPPALPSPTPPPLGLTATANGLSVAPRGQTAGTTYVVQRGKVTRVVRFAGRVSPVEQVPLYFKISGYVQQVYARQGDQVKAGDLLAELETDDLLNQIAQAEGALTLVQLLLSKAQTALEQEVATSRLNLDIAQARLTQAQETNAYQVIQAGLALSLAQEQLARTKTLQATYTASVTSARVGVQRAGEMVRQVEIAYREALDRPWEPPEVRDAAASQLEQARWDLEIAQAEYEQAMANEQAYDHDVAIAEIAVKQAEAELEQLKKGSDPLLAIQVQQARQALEFASQTEVDPQLASNVDQAKLRLDRLKQELASGQILSPVDGEVVSLSLYPGRLVEAFKASMVIADPSAIEVSADLSDAQARALYEGQKVAVVLASTASSTPGTWKGTIRCLPYPYGTCAQSNDPTGADNTVRIRLEGQTMADTSALKIGTLVRVNVVLQEKGDALWLPPEALRTFQDRQFVIVQEGERQRRVDIEVGIRSQEQVEIISGLEEGQVIVAP